MIIYSSYILRLLPIFQHNYSERDYYSITLQQILKKVCSFFSSALKCLSMKDYSYNFLNRKY